MLDMSPAEEVLFTALEKATPAERAAYLDEACAGQPDLRARVERLLAAHPKVGAFLEPVAGDDPSSRSELPHALHGTIVAGKYKLLQQIGEGGMGTVWMADQTEPIKRRVALKLIRVERGNSATILARFAAERQAIALMDHPHIAKLLDAGTTDVGQPYFVMELVKGVPLTEFCDVHKLSIEQRLGLFQQICSAVQHAHQKGIIHRDLKPTNVLVESHDGQPVPKVIDFGLAKATSGLQLTEHSLFTAFGSVLGTPLYMAPEQANFNAIDVDTRADIYALGVILYELLTGTTPLTRDTAKKAALDEMLKLVREQEAPTPSSRLSSADALPSVAANRQSEPTKLGRFVKGDLDWIVLKALSKERDRRYETANGFAKDIERFLNHEPVQAGPVGTTYKLRKFVRRNRSQVIAASLVLFALLAGMFGTTVGLIRAERAVNAERIAKEVAEEQKGKALRSAEREAEERKKADTARVEALAKEAEANAVVKFFEDYVFAAARPQGQDGGLGKDVTLRGAIAASLPALGKGFADQPLVEARLRSTLALTFDYLGELEAAVEQCERARAIYAEQRGPNHPQTLSSMNELATSYDALGRHADALRLYEETLAAQRQVLPPDHPSTLASLHNLAISYNAMGRHADALKLLEEALAGSKRVLPPDHSDTLVSMNELATSFEALGRHDDALMLREETLAAQRRVLPPDHPQTLGTMNNLANSYATLGRDSDALRLREEALAGRQRVLPPDHLDTLMGKSNLANSYATLGRHADAVKLREEALAAQRRVLPPDHAHTLMSMGNLASSYVSLGRHADALKLYEETLAAQERVLPPDHPNTLMSLGQIAEVLVKLDRGADAIPFIDDCVTRAVDKVVDPRLIPRMMNLRIRHFQQAGDADGCRATAATWEMLHRTDADSLYDAACMRAVAAAVGAMTPGADAVRLAKDDADWAMQWLTKSVAAGFKDLAHMETDADLTALRERVDFKQLVIELEDRSERK